MATTHRGPDAVDQLKRFCTAKPETPRVSDGSTVPVSHGEEGKRTRMIATTANEMVDLVEPVAIVGVGCRLGGDISSPAEFFEFLLAGRSAVGEVPPERWKPYVERDPRNAAVLRNTTRFGTFLADLAGFDADFFGVSPREAELMDPQQRLAVEVSWEALEDAGIPPRSLAGTDTAVLMGVNSDDYGKLLIEDLPGIEAWTGIGTSMCGIANRVSHLLDLRGPSVALDAACASSLVAVSHACQLLRSGETNLALAGGVSALIGPGLTRVLDEAGAIAADGRCKSFDSRADGYGRGEGAAVVVLKRLGDAQRDGDRILATIRGGAVGQDGRTAGIMAPNGQAQEHVFRLACRAAHVEPGSIDFVEAHGTGTPVGDSVEISALSRVYGLHRPPGTPCLIGSVKPNTGHLEGGAGVVGLIKTALALHHGVIPPTAGVEQLTPAVDWSSIGLRVPVDPHPWPRGERVRRAAVCSYGYGGTLAHLVLEEAPADIPQPAFSAIRAQRVLPLSAPDGSRLREQARALAEHLAASPQPLPEIAATLWTRRDHDRSRAAVLADDCADLVTGLRLLAQGNSAPSIVSGDVVATPTGPVWVFSGHGSQWAGMGADLLREAPVFAAVVDEIDPVFQAELGFSARAALLRGDLGGTDQVQALTFAMQVGLAAVLRDRGVFPAAVIGHSVGEVAACVVAGAVGLAEGAAIACYRARGFRSVSGSGAMALVHLAADEAERRLSGRLDVVVAIDSSPVSCVISGSKQSVDEVSEELSANGIAVRPVNTDVAFHSPAMKPLTGELRRRVVALPPSLPPKIPQYSTALLDPRSTAARDADYWVANLADRVRFTEAVLAASDDGHRVFLEVSAHPVVAHSISETLIESRVADHAVIPVLRRDQPAMPAIDRAVAALHCHGAPVAAGIPATAKWACGLPGTQWQHRHFWRSPSTPVDVSQLHDVDTHTLLGGCIQVAGPAPSRVWRTRLDLASRPYPGDHPVHGIEIVPAAVLLNTLLRAAGTDLADVNLRTPVAPSVGREVQVVRHESAVYLATRLVAEVGHSDEDAWLTHTTAVTVPADEGCCPPAVFTAGMHECGEVLDPDYVVDLLASLGVTSMGFPWKITELRRGERTLSATVSADPSGADPCTWAALIDAATSAASTIFPGPPRLRMPSHIERVRLLGRPTAQAKIYITSTGDATTTVDVLITDENAQVTAAMTGLRFAELEKDNADSRTASQLVHRVAWHPAEVEGKRPSEVVLVGDDDTARGYCDALNSAGQPFRLVATPLAVPDDLAADAAVVLLPRPEEGPVETADRVLGALKHLRSSVTKARLWAVTQGVHDGSNLNQAPLWGLSRVAAVEQPDVWGGVLDLCDMVLPVDILGGLAGNGVVAVRGGVPLVARLGPATIGSHPPMRCSPGGTYLITGGTGALGLQTARHLSELGARRLVLLSRSGLPPRRSWGDEDAPRDVIGTIEALEANGVTVRVVATDISKPEAVKELRSALADLPPVRGVVHAAGATTSALLSNTTTGDLHTSMDAKVLGAMNLDAMFPPGQLDWMVLFSSCGYLVGFPGQSAYACGNAFLDALAERRRRQGDRTTSIAWTAWRGLGMGSDSEFVVAQLGELGMGLLDADDAFRAWDLAWRHDTAHVVVLPLLPEAAKVPFLSDVAPKSGTDQQPARSGPVRTGTELDLWVADGVIDAIAAELQLSASEINSRRPLPEFGVDSVMAVALRRRLEGTFSTTLPPTLMWESPTPEAIRERIVELLGAASGTPS